MTDARSRRRARCCALLLLAGAARAGAQQQLSTFVNFESGHVRPLAFVDTAMTDLLLAVNTPDNRLAVYTVTATGLSLAVEVPVGLEPVAVAARRRADGSVQAFVVNHLSDSVSVVAIDPAAPGAARVTRTLLVGDEPRDVVVAGLGRRRVFVTAAHRGQNRPGDPQLTTEGVGRADVWAFDAESLGAPLGGTPLAIVQLPGDTPRALAVNADGSRVYAAVFLSGNRTTVIPAPSVVAGMGMPPPPPRLDPPLKPWTVEPPDTGLIVRQEAATDRWQDELWHDWSLDVPFEMPDEDLFVIDATTSPPARAAAPNAVAGLGTVIFNLAVRPGTGAVYATNTEARNQIRFEPVLQGHITESRVTVVHGTAPTPVHLNPHILYDGHPGLTPGPDPESVQTLASPTDLVFSSDGATLYVAAFGSDKVGVFDSALLESGATTPRGLVPVGAGPSGLALDESRNRLYVMNHRDHTISIVDNVSDPVWRSVSATIPLPYTPEPTLLRAGRRFLYDATLTSAHGDASCASCHIFGDFDGLAWDLGNPFADKIPSNPNPPIACLHPIFHPMKGPMTTQSLRGMDEAGPMHWRADRTSAVGGIPGSQNDEFFAFLQFEPAFALLLGRDIDAADMEKFAHFVLTIRYPPNPVHALDNAPTPAETRAFDIYHRKGTDVFFSCNDCHALPLGTNGFSSCDLEPQSFKVPHLRNMYQKVGRFGMPGEAAFSIPAHQATAPVLRGFAFLHDGSVSTLGDFLQADAFTLTQAERDDLVAFMLGFDTGLAPAVGQQVTVTSASASEGTVDARITLLLARADAGDCDLVVKGRLAGVQRGWLHEAVTGTGLLRSDLSTEPLLPEATVRLQAATAGQERTYTCVPPGSGARIGIDRDDDGTFDGDEALAGTPLDPPPDLVTTSTSTTVTTTTTTSTRPPLPPGFFDDLKKIRKKFPPFHLPPLPDPPPFHQP